MSYILAQYTIRSKQDYIFRSNRVLEIIGASNHISRSWDILMEQAGAAGLKVAEVSELEVFDMEEVEKRLQKGDDEEEKLHMVELFRGGGNDTVLYDNIDSYRAANRKFSRHLMEKYPGMIPMAVCCKYTGDYKKDYQKLMEESEREKNRMVPGQSSFILPFSMMDRNSFQPYSRVVNYEKGKIRLTEENYRKRKSGRTVRDEDMEKHQDNSVKILDEMVTKRGEESLLAVIHADGNNMGKKISVMLGDETDYTTCVKNMREFTADTANAFITEGLQALEKCRETLKEKHGKKYRESAYFYRKIISDGDDMTFICNARFAMEYVKAYLQSVQTYQERHNSSWSYSSCAGICIFHGHYPFARAYSMAEQACDDGAKQKVHVTSGTVEEGWVDFHYIHSGIGGDLMSIREYQGTGKCMARPWLVAGGDLKNSRHYNRLIQLNELLQKYHVARADIKTIGSEYEDSQTEAEKELPRIFGHHKGLEDELEKIFGSTQEQLKIIYDLSEIYDLWFKEGK
ncbi:MAG: hypothetical protein SOW08_04605 [Lachnospiraceae bacterium]|nr:hypothetical protein [Lachnospiraceae bacterium]